MVIKFINNKVNQVDIYPEYINKEWMKNVPITREAVKSYLGDAEEIIKSSCYESASCEEWLYRNDKELLKVLFRWDNDTVDRSMLQ